MPPMYGYRRSFTSGVIHAWRCFVLNTMWRRTWEKVPGIQSLRQMYRRYMTLLPPLRGGFRVWATYHGLRLPEYRLRSTRGYILLAPPGPFSSQVPRLQVPRLHGFAATVSRNTATRSLSGSSTT